MHFIIIIIYYWLYDEVSDTDTSPVNLKLELSFQHHVSEQLTWHITATRSCHVTSWPPLALPWHWRRTGLSFRALALSWRWLYGGPFTEALPDVRYQLMRHSLAAGDAEVEGELPDVAIIVIPIVLFWVFFRCLELVYLNLRGSGRGKWCLIEGDV